MTTLPTDQRRLLEKAVRSARKVSVIAAEAALARLGVGAAKSPSYLTVDEQALRRRLRAHARHVGDGLLVGGEHETRRLAHEVAYEHWHRMLFARFLAENQLLMHPELGVAVSLEECAELAKEAGHEDAWLVAAAFAARMLPAIFRPDDAALAVALAPEYRRQLEGLVLGLPASTFTASDSLGWVYQFWQADEKDRVNASEVKIGADELPAVTQLFTEPYMVQFLLHNSLGAWWAAKRLTPEQLATAESELELRDAVALPGYAFTYLRFVREAEDQPWRPAAGTFSEWPRTLQGFKTLDPCCGSGHFLVELLHLLARLRMVDEGLSARAAVDAVLRENLHGLEIDARCTQIAVFAVALAAWSFPDAGGFRALPPVQVACCGLKPAGTVDEWMALADRVEDRQQRDRLRAGLERVWRVFQQAPILGSLVDPGTATGQGDLFSAGWDQVQPLVQQALLDRRLFDTDERAEIGVAASGLADAARVLTDRYQLAVTNVPYLARGKQDPVLAEYAAEHYPDAKADLANVFLERCLELAAGGVTQVVMPQNWLFLPAYKAQRKKHMQGRTWPIIARLGSGAFSSIGGEVVKVVLLSVDHNGSPEVQHVIRFIDCMDARDIPLKLKALAVCMIGIVTKSEIREPNFVINFSANRSESLLGDSARAWQGLVTGDDNKFVFFFWETSLDMRRWQVLQRPPAITDFYTGRSELIRWDGGIGDLHMKSNAHNFPPKSVVGRMGVAIQRMSSIRATLYTGEIFNDAVAPVIPHDSSMVPALWALVSDTGFAGKVREINQKVNVTPGSFHEVRWNPDELITVSKEIYPNGLPKPFTNDPNQHLFHGHPCGSVIWDDTTKWTAEAPLRRDATVLHIALARLVGYRWPTELDEAMELADEQRAWVQRCEALLPFADDDGIVCLPSVRGEAPAADRLRDLLAAAYGAEWSAGILAELLTNAGHAGRSLEVWLRDHAFKEHCALFQQRPFVWHIWDGAKEGFSAFVNYHRLDRRGLENLTYTYLGDWITAQKRDAAAQVAGADLRRAAAEALQARLVQILEGEAPFDIFVRWKPLHEQPLGWEPDLDDGVRLNIRPFLTAEVLRWQPKIKYGTDRGKDPESAPWFALFQGERNNDHHTTLAEKRAARERHTGRKGG